MVLDSRMHTVTFEDLLKEANIVGGREAAGWTHETIVRILRNHGIHAYRQEFKAHEIDLETGEPTPAQHSGEFAQQGILKIRRNVDDGNPVLVSVSSGFSDNTEDHVVLVIGYDEESIIVHDPLLAPDSNPVSVPVRKFMDFWKRLTIFTE
jgi:hypothetical protein